MRGVIAGAAGGAVGAVGSISAASLGGPMGPCILGRDKVKRPKKWADWLWEVENKMRFGGITENDRKWYFLRSCAGGGGERMELWDKELRVVYTATRDGADRVEADTYDQVVKNTTVTLLKLVNRDRAIIELLQMEQGSRTCNEFLADIEDQTHLCHSWEKLTPEDMKRISLLGGLKDRTLAEKAIAEE